VQFLNSCEVNRQNGAHQKTSKEKSGRRGCISILVTKFRPAILRGILRKLQLKSRKYTYLVQIAHSNSELVNQLNKFNDFIFMECNINLKSSSLPYCEIVKWCSSGTPLTTAGPSTLCHALYFRHVIYKLALSVESFCILGYSGVWSVGSQ
jgi:hypothetical protein